tara:strand:- start:843 stop:1262 length:420 start_codon:yes stop_codon:yes gene_type:complete
MFDLTITPIIIFVFLAGIIVGLFISTYVDKFINRRLERLNKKSFAPFKIEVAYIDQDSTKESAQWFFGLYLYNDLNNKNHYKKISSIHESNNILHLLGCDKSLPNVYDGIASEMILDTIKYYFENDFNDQCIFNIKKIK